ncbi:double-strand break repair helicase AddA [Tateyamaria pelophila]|uniref:double-strand break repair helicase AddA n=1 Tax=Tateyamaria pelophila TaxID=328415 RepID=UPI001CBED71E|nr:double-strand break repair helicase AddA [Tateyamaria pelophila]
MTPADEATRRQQDAARPMESTWLSANAGSGKTRVLTDRVARLLLQDVQPQHILCLTYTKAAASEMQNRLFQRLGAWAMLDDDELRVALAELGLDRTPSPDDLRHARTLFARAIETPGGLKIQTIHSFCAALLRRFPLEAGVSPQFTEIEDRAAELLRAELMDTMAGGPDANLVTDLAQLYTGEDILKFTKQVVAKGDAFSPLTLDDALILLGAQPGLTRDKIVSDTFAPGDANLLQDLTEALAGGSSNDQRDAAKLSLVQDLDFAAIPEMTSVFVNASGQNANAPKFGKFPTKPTQKKIDHLMPRVEALMQRVADARAARLALVAAEKTVMLHRFGNAFAQRYAAAKQQRGWLDFDDLIQKARHLLTDDKVAAWVLYRLDGGIDHILVDEAQDTSPTQWDVIRKLAEEFSSGEGARADITRTIFVVGDKKQSIYSFQGADPREFDRMETEFGSKLAEVDQRLNSLTLDYSFRSSPAILRLVDMVFDGATSAGFAADGKHIAFHTDLPGRVDLWPVVPKPDKEEKRHWYDPVDRRSATHQNRVLAKAIADQIKRMLDTRAMIPDGTFARAVQPKDFLILVQRRSGIFSDIIQACKELELPIAGADRLKVGAETAVRDLGALLSFLATPDDSLSLATVLRSPLFGWSEQDLFTLAHHRKTEHLWATLRDLDEKFPETVPVLKDLRANVDFLRPYDLIERMLTRHRGRKRLLARLGAEAEDGINALLSQALSFERAVVPSLTGFLTWMETDDLEIKRQIDSASNQIRVMTVHGAKGLEAPIVILPECGKRTLSIRDDIIVMDDTPVWRMNDKQQPDCMVERLDAMKEAQQEESLRLLYVALTRAEKWLIVAASGDLDSSGNDWHQRVGAGMKASGAVDLITPVGMGMRVEHGAWDFDLPDTGPKSQPGPPALPDVYTRPAPHIEPTPETLSPSDLGGAKALPGEGLDEDSAKAYGTLLHAFLEKLPAAASNDWTTIIKRLAKPSILSEGLITEAEAEARAVLDDPQLAHVFAPDSLAEVPVTAKLGSRQMHGTIDRLILTDDCVQIIDFKSNRHVPDDPVQCPEAVLRQMGAYAQAIRAIYPDHRIESYVLWTRERKLMRLPHDIVTAALYRSQYLDVDPMGS